MVTTPSFYNLKDQGIYAAGDFFIPQERYRAAPYTVNKPTNNPDEVPAGIPTVYQPQGSGGGGGGSYTGGVNDLIQNYTLDTRNQYFDSQKTPLIDRNYEQKLQSTFMGFPSFRQQELTGPDLGEYIGGQEIGYTPGGEIGFSYGQDIPLELTTAGKIQNTLGNIKDKASGIMSNIKGFGPVSMVLGAMDRFGSLSPADQEFIKQNMGYIGPTVFGENTSGLSKDPFGINTRSAFGNYADYVGEKSASLGESLQESAEKAGLSYDPATGEVTGGTDDEIEEWEKLTNLKRTKQQFYFQKEKERIKNEKEMAEKAAAEAAAAAKRERDFAAQGKSDPNDPSRQGASGRRPGSGSGPTVRDDQGDRDSGQTGGYSYDSGGRQGFGYGLADGGRVYYMDGGLADLVDIYD